MSTLAKLLTGMGGKEELYEGGHYAGRITVDGVEYALVVAPRAQGDAAPRRWKTTETSTSGTGSRNNGWSNTQAMIQAGSAVHPAAAFCRGLNINGYDDWYLPSRDELEILYRAFKPTTQNNDTNYGANPSAIPPRGNYTSSNPPRTSLSVFQAGGGEDFIASTYWSSTQGGSGWSWFQNFLTGFQSSIGTKTIAHRVRAVRRVAIEE